MLFAQSLLNAWCIWVNHAHPRWTVSTVIRLFSYCSKSWTVPYHPLHLSRDFKHFKWLNSSNSLYELLTKSLEVLKVQSEYSVFQCMKTIYTMLPQFCNQTVQWTINDDSLNSIASPAYWIHKSVVFLQMKTWTVSDMKRLLCRHYTGAVSYTHLTLPTNREV